MKQKRGGAEGEGFSINTYILINLLSTNASLLYTINLITII